MVKTKGGDRKLTEEYVFGKNFPDVVNLVNDFFNRATAFGVKHKDYTKAVARPIDIAENLYGHRGGSFRGRGLHLGRGPRLRTSVHDGSDSKEKPNYKPGGKRESPVPKEENSTKREKCFVKLLEFSKLKF